MCCGGGGAGWISGGGPRPKARGARRLLLLVAVLLPVVWGLAADVRSDVGAALRASWRKAEAAVSGRREELALPSAWVWEVVDERRSASVLGGSVWPRPLDRGGGAWDVGLGMKAALVVDMEK